MHDYESDFEYTFSIYESNETLIFTAGVINDVYQVSLGIGTSAITSENRSGQSFDDSLAITIDFSDSTYTTLDVISIATEISTSSQLSRDIGAVNFSSGGRIQITSARFV